VRRDGRSDLLFHDGRESQPRIDRLNRPRRSLAHGQRLFLADRAQSGIDLHVSLQHVIVVQVVAVKASAAKQVVITRHDAES